MQQWESQQQPLGLLNDFCSNYSCGSGSTLLPHLSKQEEQNPYARPTLIKCRVSLLNWLLFHIYHLDFSALKQAAV